MKSLVIFGLAICLVAVHARHYTDRNDNEKRTDDDLTENVESVRDYRGGQMRHRRKRWQMSYGYDYPPPNPYYPERRDYDRNQELIPQIWRLLDEISAYVKRPPPPPMLPPPIYVPYPVPYPVPQNCTCNVQVVAQPNVTKRFPELEDPNQIWGVADTNEEIDEDEGDGSRPISFDPIKPKTPMARPQPEVEHGSNQATNVQEERVPPSSSSAGTCNAAILTCCSETRKQQKPCFTNLGCSMTFSRGNACSKQSIANAIESFRQAYSPSLQ